MKIKKVILTNFRGYRNPTEINFNDLTVFVGRMFTAGAIDPPRRLRLTPASLKFNSSVAEI